MKIELNRVTWYSRLLALALVIVLPFLGFWLGMKYQEAVSPSSSVVSSNPTTQPPATSSAKPTPGESKKQVTNSQLTIKVTYQNGIYYYSGTIELPTPCTILTVNSNVTRTAPSVVNILITTQPTDAICAQAVTPKTFSGQVSGPANATVDVYLNDKLVN